ncbi:hypothetical protein, partial [Pseudomonas baetica]|uniref:hypothetical protein n=1 Tax=Pseudomonas baetica TaxID=674054 RepID=UPI0028714299
MIKKHPPRYKPRFKRPSASYSHVIHSQLHSKRGQVKTVQKQPFAASICRALAGSGICFPQFQNPLDVMAGFHVGAAAGCGIFFVFFKKKKKGPGGASKGG